MPIPAKFSQSHSMPRTSRAPTAKTGRHGLPGSRAWRLGWLAVFAAALGLLLPGPGESGMFKWRDKNGTTHYTNDLSQVPRDYRRSGNIQKMRSVDPAPRPRTFKTPPAKAPGANEKKVETSSPDLKETNPDLNETENPGAEKSASVEKPPPAPEPLPPPPKFKKNQWKVIRDYSATLDSLVQDFSSILDSAKKYKLAPKWYFQSAQRFQKAKEEMLLNFYSARLEVLKPAARFFLNTQTYDFSLEEGGKDTQARLELLKVRMQTEVDQAKELKIPLDALLKQAPSP